MIDSKRALEQLEVIKKDLGIEFIEQFIIKAKPKTKKKRGRKPSGLNTGASVYFDLFGMDMDKEESYKKFMDLRQIKSITESKETIANKRGTTEGTVDKQVTKFNKFAESMDYKDFARELEQDMTKNRMNIEEFYDGEYEALKYFIYNYSDEKTIQPQQAHYSLNSTPMFETFGDSRYQGLDERLAIALYLKYKYEKIKNAHIVKERETYLDVPF